ncbi:MAG: hemolysin III family protein [Candidatus Marinimicrobia bacterium]|nr:hemolysin III family protein [Candidatus Neomarinimicrobiota bacterium]MCF7904537.1 hemolysin III family protein [Candidatus Neomarinimicrobiota bacterium]
MSRKLAIYEEVANTITHAIGVGLSIAGLVLLVVRAALYGDIWQVVSFSIYGTSLILLYLASTLYHGIRSKRIKQIFRILDHSAIYLLIAGTYTPFVLVTLRGPWGWTLFGIIWGLAFLGITFKITLGTKYEFVSTAFYVAMGWVVIIAIKPLIAALPLTGLMWLVAGGLAYTGGVVFYVWEKLPFNHAIWHGFVLAGSLLHFFTVWLYLTPAAISI